MAGTETMELLVVAVVAASVERVVVVQMAVAVAVEAVASQAMGDQ
jgi:hypothetical protein